MLAMLVMVSSGQLATEKMRLQNTGDAAAYSGALVQSRDYNFSAYTNRAMVANQVAIAQMVGMTSWARHNQQVFTRTVFSRLPCFLALAGTPDDSWDCYTRWDRFGQQASSIRSTVERFSGRSISVLDDLIGALSNAQDTYHLGTFVAVPLTVKEVIAANDPDAVMPVTITNIGFDSAFSTAFSKFSKSYASNGELRRFADVTHRSLDIFSGLSSTAQRVGPIPFPMIYTWSWPRSQEWIEGVGGNHVAGRNSQWRHRID